MPPSPFTPALETALRHALHHLDGPARRPVNATTSLAALRARLGRPLADHGLDPAQVIDEPAAAAAGGILGSNGGRFFGWVIGGTLPAALAADWLTAAWDQNAAIHACGPAVAVIEEVAGLWLKDLFGLPAAASFAFVTGTQGAHVTCLAAARHRLLAQAGWDVEEHGLAGAPPIRIITSSERHGSVERAVRLLGFGKRALVPLPCNAQGQLEAATLAHAPEASPPQPTIVLLQAGDLNIGAFDPFAELIPIARRHGAWVHVDGAFGLWAAASPRYRPLVEGFELADSWATDGHKWLNVPYDSGYAFVAHSRPHRASMSHRAVYLTHDPARRDQIDWNPEWSRRARGFSTYAALRELGRNGVAALIERCCNHARAIVDGIGRLPGAEVLWRPIINQGLVRFGDDRRTDQVIAAIAATGEAFFTGTTWRGMRAMRVSVCNWRTSEEDVNRTL